jgi:hypothetical protein
MARPVGRPPDSLAAQLRAWYVNTTTTDTDRAFLQGQMSAWDMEIAARNGTDTVRIGRRTTAKPQPLDAQPEIPLREPGV